MLRFLTRRADEICLTDGEHLLRLPNYADHKQWSELRRESKDYLQRWEPSWRAGDLSESAFRARVNRNRQEYASGIAIPLFIFNAHNNQLLGGLTVGHIRRGASQTCMIGYWMGQRFAGHGHMKAALKLTVHHIFEALQLHRIEAACIPENTRSIGLLESNGFRREGFLRDYLKINGEWRTHIMMSRLSTDPRPAQGTNITV